MKMKKKAILGILVFLGLLFLPARVFAIPMLPSSFYGTVTYNGENVPDGTLVEALVNDQVAAQGYCFTYEEKSIYSLNVGGDDPATPAQEGGREGDMIAFLVGGLPADQTGIWRSGTNVELNLAVISSLPLGSPQATPTAIATQTPIGFAGSIERVEQEPAAKFPTGIYTAIIALIALSGGFFYFRRKK